MPDDAKIMSRINTESAKIRAIFFWAALLLILIPGCRNDMAAPSTVNQVAPAVVASSPTPTSLPVSVTQQGPDIPTATVELPAEPEPQVVEADASPAPSPTETRTPRATATALPTRTPRATATPTPETPTPGPSPTPDALVVRAIDDAALFKAALGNGGRIGYYVPKDFTSWAAGRSPDGTWLHIIHYLGVEGWGLASLFNLDSRQIAALPVSWFVVGRDMQEVYTELTATAVVEAGLTASAVTPTVTPTPTATPTAPVVRALRDAAMFAAPGGGGRIGYYIPEGQTAWALGRAENISWIHVLNRAGVEGWISAEFIAFESGSFARLPVSQFLTTPNPAVTPWYLLTPTATATPPWPTRTPTPVWPTRTPTPVWPTRTPTPVWPTRTPAAVRPTATPLPAPVVGRPVNTPTPLPYDPGMSSAFAFWYVDQGSLARNADNTWRADVIARVPTSFSYSFELNHLAQIFLRDQNRDGDDYYVLRLNNISCGQPYNSRMTVRQNGMRMHVRHEFTDSDGPVAIQFNCY
jgi:hypothetical protein